MDTTTLIQTIIVLAIVAVCLILALRHFIKIGKGKGDCGCGKGSACRNKHDF